VRACAAAEPRICPGSRAKKYEHRIGVFIVDLEALSGILQTAGLQPEKLAILSYQLDRVHSRYEISKIMRRVTPAKKLTKVCNEISAATTILTTLLDQYAELTAFFKEFVELDTDKLVELLDVLDWGARQGYEILSGKYEQDGPNDHDQDLQTIEPLSFEATVASRLIARSMATARGRREEPKTQLFVDLRELFMRLGGTNEIGSGGPLYRFTKACAEAIDREIQVPEPEPFRILMMAALKRRLVDTV
jgi:hypothetical protein